MSAVLLLGLLVPAAPATAQSGPPGTIVYIQDGDVIASTPDGSQSHVVAGGGNWGEPAITDDGIVVAVRDGTEIVRMTQAGQELSAFTPSILFASGIHELDVTEDGEYVVYGSIQLCSRPNGDFDTCRTHNIVYADGRTPESLGGVVQSNVVTFWPGQPLAVTRGVDTFGLGADEPTDGFDEGIIDTADLDISRDGSLLATAGCDYDAVDDDFNLSCAPLIRFHVLNGPPPAQPTPVTDCFLTNAEEAVRFDAVSFSPDATAFVYSERGEEEDLDQADVKVQLDFSVSPCSGGAESTRAEGAQSPHWGAATYDPSGGDPVDPGEPGEPGGPGQPGQNPEGTFRVDGGGVSDPVGQAIATSQSLFEDGQADRVVLATADRFPDALAGAALAGVRGPILLTPSNGPLDPDVAAELQRVTGGDGVVLTLGGEAAVTEQAAGQARAAAGDRACTAPLPSSCRYAGTGREDTAAQIAATVLAENPGQDRVLIARGDAFADAITGGAYAARAGVPILLTPSTTLAAQTSGFLQSHPEVVEAVILGGEAAVSGAVAGQLGVDTVGRVAGDDRTATSAAIATELWQAEGLAGGGVVVVNVRHEQGWQTALSAAVVSAAVGAPQLGVENPPAAPTQAVLDAAGVVGTSQVITFGGGDLVAPSQLAAIQAAG